MRPLTAESLQRALAEGEEQRVNVNSRRMLAGDDDFPASLSLWTPYSEATMRAAAARRRFEPRPTMSLDELNRHQIEVVVRPFADFTKAVAIDNVMIKRGSAVVRALKADVKPVEIRNGLGARRMVSEGTFTFPFSAFDPSEPITLVLIGRARNYEWFVPRDELARMK
jgi:hypothetical protein